MRLLVGLLLFANLLFFGWSRGWLDGVAGVRAQGDREPERLAQQIRPDAVRVLTADEAARAAEAASAAQAAAAAAASTAGSAVGGAGAAAPGAAGNAAPVGASPSSAAGVPPARPAASAAGVGSGAVGSAAAARAGAAAASTAMATATTVAAGNASTVTSTTTTTTGIACLEAGPFDDATFATAQVALRQALPTVRWVDVRTASGGAWMVYMGKYPSREVQARKEAELSRIHIAFQEVSVPAELGPGLSLGRFDSRAAAEAALAQFTRHGIRTARVVELQPPSPAHLLRVEPFDAVQAARVLALPAVGAGRRFAACRSG